MLGFGAQEFIFVIIVIVVLSATGLWPKVIRALRELRGESIPEDPPEKASDLDMCYRLLGLSPSASWNEIETAYRNKAKIHHPDKGGDEDAMRALNEAYARLKRLKK